jgi:hypothetical protein
VFHFIYFHFQAAAVMQTQHVNLDEGQETCSSGHDICFGKLSIYKFNFTTTANESISAIKLNLNKGCSSLQKLEGNFTNILRAAFTPISFCQNNQEHYL